MCAVSSIALAMRHAREMSLEAEMLLPREGDDLGQKAKATMTFVRAIGWSLGLREDVRSNRGPGTGDPP